MLREKRRVVQVLLTLIVISMVLAGCGGKEGEGSKHPLDKIEGITELEKRKYDVMSHIIDSREGVYVNKNQKGIDKKLEEMGINKDDLEDFIIYTDKDKMYVMVNTEVGKEVEVVDALVGYLMERRHEETEKLDMPEEEKEGYFEARTYITSYDDYFMVIEDDYPAEMGVELLMGIVDEDYELKTRQEMQKDIEKEIERQLGE